MDLGTGNGTQERQRFSLSLQDGVGVAVTLCACVGVLWCLHGEVSVSVLVPSGGVARPVLFIRRRADDEKEVEFSDESRLDCLYEPGTNNAFASIRPSGNGNGKGEHGRASPWGASKRKKKLVYPDGMVQHRAGMVMDGLTDGWMDGRTGLARLDWKEGRTAPRLNALRPHLHGLGWLAGASRQVLSRGRGPGWAGPSGI